MICREESDNITGSDIKEVMTSGQLLDRFESSTDTVIYQKPLAATIYTAEQVDIENASTFWNFTTHHKFVDHKLKRKQCLTDRMSGHCISTLTNTMVFAFIVLTRICSNVTENYQNLSICLLTGKER